MKERLAVYKTHLAFPALQVSTEVVQPERGRPRSATIIGQCELVPPPFRKRGGRQLQVPTLKHEYGYEPVQSTLSTYTRAAVFVGASSLDWCFTKALSGEVTATAKFVYGSLDLSDIALKYQVTNEPSILDISSSVSTKAHNYTLAFSGCDETADEPYAFNSILR